MASTSDHGESFSIYFADPWGNPFEVTSYDAEEIRAAARVANPKRV